MWTRANRPDVMLIQETKQSAEKFPHAEFRELGYETAHFGQGRWNGVAIASRVGLDNVREGFGEPDEEARLIGASCGPLRLYSCYVPNGRALDDPHYAYKLRWLDSLTQLVHEETSENLVVAGDFNVAPTDLDCYDPSKFIGATHVSDAERQRLGNLVAEGLVDVTRVLHPDDPCYTWWDYRQGSFHRGWGLRIDLVYVSRHLADLTAESHVDRDERKGERPSDHAPVVVTIEL